MRNCMYTSKHQASGATLTDNLLRFSMDDSENLCGEINRRREQ